ncbi:MAG: phage portal protein [Nitrospinaceae bacterium]|nr:phage portal protein [Nitrospinaceae bacterium]NIR55597.1 phage portal protein [Nitrospinaceae bacterium]NIS86031.1 phage portal protein [Nitrospinaceae bacterium]NIT82874.1 phage portal protein [Nitrospinaceae bacterium]NIU45079.1 phage portal protein [Nitrospinaceae bacterium]
MINLTGLLNNFFGFFSGLSRRFGRQHVTPLTRSTTPAAAVNFDTAMAVPAFWAAVRLLSEAVGGLPLLCFVKSEDGFQEKTDHPLWRLINFNPNRYQTRVEFFETVILNLATTGNSFCAIERSASGRVVSLLPLMSGNVSVELAEDGSILYHHFNSKGDLRVFAEQSIWHVKLFGNGIVGLSPLGYAASTLGISIATQGRQSKLAKSGGKTNGILMVDRVLDDEKRAAIRKNFNQLTEGSEDQLFILEAEMKFERAALSPQDMQMLDTYKFQVQEIARIMGVPSVLINDANITAWGKGIEIIMDGFYKLGLRPYLERIEASIKRNLMDQKDWDRVFIEFDFEGLLRPRFKERIETFGKAIQTGQMTPNEARAEEGRPPIEGGDELVMNGGMEPVTLFQQPQETEEEPEPEPEPPPAPEPAPANLN